ncbi:MAG TPA: TPM domain-containing protein [Candidatus Aenigmarchaeota archaeon]|nr:TPM domain-containing protein [Candidatus Aenigmarchaeota archaeon]
MKKYAIFILLFAVTAFALPQSTGFVNDYANILPDRAQFEEGLLLYEQNTTIEVAVVTLDSVPEGYTLFSYGVDLFKEWGIGKKGEDNGILILMVKNGTVGNRMRIELGWGIQGYITGSEAGTILDKAMPYYTQGDYQTALDIILLGLSDELVDYVPGKVVPRDQTVDIILSLVLGNFPLFVFLVIIIIPIAMSNRCPYCRGKIKCEGDYCTCLKCKKKFKRKKRYAPLIIGGFGGGGGGFGGGGFGGGGSGGGGAGR